MRISQISYILAATDVPIIPARSIVGVISCMTNFSESWRFILSSSQNKKSF